MLRVAASLLCLVAIGVLATAFPVHASYAASIAISQTQMANIVVGTTEESIRWAPLDQSNPILVTLFFHSFEDSGQIIDESIISTNRTGYPENVTDPTGTFRVAIDSSQPSTTATLVFTIFSQTALPSITVSAFYGATVTNVGLPGTTVTHSVATAANTIEDVIINNQWLASFNWNFVQQKNQTVPQLAVYDTSGAQIDGRYVTETGIPLIPVRGALGFWIEAQGVIGSSVTWLLESTFAIEARPNVGFQLKALPTTSGSFTLTGDFYGNIPTATVWWALPQGSNQQTVSIGGIPVGVGQCQVESIVNINYAPGSCGIVISQDQSTGIWSISFKPKQLGMVIPVTVDTLGPNGKYESTMTVTFKVDPFWDINHQPNIFSILASSLGIAVFAFLFVLAYRRRRPKRYDPTQEYMRLIGRGGKPSAST